ncbi:hypothetical protein, partial [Nonomuraea sp. NPDC059022]|uniref:hypothetical protein n=1 Tax=Nonomuraea sp. NPDC059022 TaxID=3346705 RepID=UPI00369B993C
GIGPKGWALALVHGTRGKKVWHRWEITDLGLEARANATIVDPRPRPNWRHWEPIRLSAGEVVVAGHTLVRPGPTMLWQVVCPGQQKPIGYRTYLDEAVELLADHVYATTEHGDPRDPAVPLPSDGDGVVDLDQPDTTPLADLHSARYGLTFHQTTPLARHGIQTVERLAELVTKHEADPANSELSTIAQLGPARVDKVCAAIARWREAHDGE